MKKFLARHMTFVVMFAMLMLLWLWSAPVPTMARIIPICTHGPNVCQPFPPTT